MAASRAPFGTDLQPKFDVRVVAGKLIHTTVADTEKQLALHRERNRGLNKARPKDTSISGAIMAHKKIKESQGNASVSTGREGVSRPRSKRARSIDIMPVVEEGVGEASEEPSPLKVANRTFVQAQHKPVNKLPNIIVQQAPQTENEVPHSKDQEEEKTALREKELYALVEMIFKPIVNKLGAVRNIQVTCNHADSANLGVLERGTVVRAFRSHGAKVSTGELSKLCDLIPCSMGSAHILYDKLCTVAEQVLDKTYPNKAVDNENTLTPTGSIGSVSPGSVEDCELGYSLPMLADRTNSNDSLPFVRPLDLFAKPRAPRSVMTHPLSKTHSKSNSVKLPQISDTAHSTTPTKSPSTAPPSKINPNVQFPLSPLETETDKGDGVEKLFNALRSCTDSEGLLESEHARRVIQNYNVIYKLGLPVHQIRDYFNINARHRPGELRPCILTEKFLRYLSDSCINK